MNKYEYLESCVNEAVSRQPTTVIKKKPAIISYGLDKKEFVLYFNYSKAASKGTNLFDGWTSFAFLSNRPLDKSTVGERIMGRRVVSGRKQTFIQKSSTLTVGAEIGTYNGIVESHANDLPMVFSSSLFKGTWALISDKTSKKKIERVWLIRKK